GRLILLDDHIARQPCGDQLLAHHILDAEEGIGRLRHTAGLPPSGRERAHGLRIRLMRGDTHQFAFRPAQSGEAATEGTAGVDIDRVVEPDRRWYWRMPVD